MSKVKGATAIETALTTTDENAAPVTAKEKLTQSAIGILQGQAKRVNKQELLLEAMSDLLMERITTTPEKFKNDFLVEAIHTLGEANNSTANVIIKALTPQKEGDGLIQLIFNNHPPEGGSYGSGGQHSNLPDNMHLKTVNIAHQAACLVIQEDAKERQRQEMLEITGVVEADD